MCQTPDERLKMLMETAQNVDVFQGHPMKNYLRFMRSMARLSESYAEQGCKDKAYTLSTRFVILYVEKLPHHREYHKLDPAQKAECKDLCYLMLKLAEVLKGELRKQYESEYALYLKSKELEASKHKSTSDIPSDKNSVSTGNTKDEFSNSRHTLQSLDSEENTGNKSPPAFDRSSKPNDLTNGHVLTKVYLAPQMIDDFLRLADKNTRENRETCATLGGHLIDGEFRITDLLLPKQSGTSDSCATYGEEEVLVYMEDKKLLPLGWIHTHPTQTAFLSAVDLHCQLSYQIMLPEAIAIVCAPKFNDVKCFSLTPNHGISVIMQCKKTGFHPHTTTQPLFEQCHHVVFDANLKYSTFDLR